MRSYYAEQSPRGFGNEVNTFRFPTKSERDAWVTKHKDDGDCNSASQGARAITAAEARKNVSYKGDAITQSYNSSYLEAPEEL